MTKRKSNPVPPSPLPSASATGSADFAFRIPATDGGPPIDFIDRKNDDYDCGSVYRGDEDLGNGSRLSEAWDNYLYTVTEAPVDESELARMWAAYDEWIDSPRRGKPKPMKSKTIIRTATALAVACSTWLAGCTKSKSDQPPAEQVIHTNPPVGDKVMVSEDGKTFMPLIGGEHYLIHSPTFTNYQDAVNRLWYYRKTAPPDQKPVENPNNKAWREYAR